MNKKYHSVWVYIQNISVIWSLFLGCHLVTSVKVHQCFQGEP